MSDNSLETLHRTHNELSSIMSDYSQELLTRRAFEGKWTPMEILGHLIDHEIVTSCRIRTIRFHELPWVERYEQNVWVASQNYNSFSSDELLRRFKELRNLNIEQYDSASDKELTHVRTRANGREISMKQLLKSHAEHDLNHLTQLKKYLEVISSQQP